MLQTLSLGVATRTRHCAVHPQELWGLWRDPVKNSDKRYQVLLVRPPSQSSSPYSGPSSKTPCVIAPCPLQGGPPGPQEPQVPWLQTTTHHTVICVENWHCLHHQIHTCCLKGTPRSWALEGPTVGWSRTRQDPTSLQRNLSQAEVRGPDNLPLPDLHCSWQLWHPGQSAQDTVLYWSFLRPLRTASGDFAKSFSHG